MSSLQERSAFLKGRRGVFACALTAAWCGAAWGLASLHHPVLSQLAFLVGLPFVLFLPVTVFLAARAKRQAQAAWVEHERLNAEAVARREEAIRQGGTPGQLSEAGADSIEGALSTLEEPGGLAPTRTRSTTSR